MYYLKGWGEEPQRHWLVRLEGPVKGEEGGIGAGKKSPDMKSPKFGISENVRTNQGEIP